MNKKKISVIEACVLVVSVLFYLILFFIDGVQISADSYGYINCHPSREALYPLYLMFFRVLFPETIYLSVAVFFQCMLAAYAVYRLTTVLERKFKLDKWSVGIIVLIQFAVVLLCKVVAVRRATYCNEICTEGLALPLFSLFITELFLCIWEQRAKNILACMLYAFALISVRKQMYIVVLIWGAVYFTVFVCRQIDFKKLLIAFLSIVITFGATIGFDILYNYVVRGEAMRHTTDSSFMVVMTLYCSKSEDASYFEDLETQKLFCDIMEVVEEKEYSMKFSEGDWLSKYQHYSSHYDAISYGVVNPHLYEYIDRRYQFPEGERERMFDSINNDFLKVLLPVRYKDIIIVATNNMLVGLFNTISKAYRILTPYNLLLILAYVGLMIYAIRKKEKDLYWLAIVTLISVCVNVVVVGFLIFAQTRYMIYNMPFVYIAGFLMVRWAWIIFLDTRKQKHVQVEK